MEIRKPPSHILADGTFVYLPEPSKVERASFFERSVAEHGLISATPVSSNPSETKDDNNETENIDDNNDNKGGQKKTKKPKKDDGVPKVHPIAIASARLNAFGIQELSKSINLGDLVDQSEYFDLANVVSSATLATPTTTTSQKSKDDSEIKKTTDASSGSDVITGKETDIKNVKNEMLREKTPEEIAHGAAIMEDQKLRASYLLKRKRRQFQNANTMLSRHHRRLANAVLCQRVKDSRLVNLRSKWRLVAPEHGTRAIGPVRPSEIVAVDVEVYDRDRTGGGNFALQQEQQQQQNNHQQRLGRISRMVPRYATIELGDNVHLDKTSLISKNSSSKENNQGSSSTSSKDWSNYTRAEPFAVADPTLGKIDTDFDPDKVPVLTLLFSVEKASTGFIQQCTLSSSSSNDNNTTDYAAQKSRSDEEPQKLDEKVIVALQHSLFCASLFESIRKEITTAKGSNNDSDVKSVSSSNKVNRNKMRKLDSSSRKLPNQQQSTYNSSSAGNNNIVWLSSGMEQMFLPPPSLLVGGSGDGNNAVAGSGIFSSTDHDRGTLCVIHCHESEVKVQLDSEYALTVRLVEVGTATTTTTTNSSSTEETDTTTEEMNGSSSSSSGSQSPEQLKLLCRTLLLHAQFIYHDFCIKTKSKKLSSNKNDEKKEVKKVVPSDPFTTNNNVSPHILQQCVALGSKTLLERKVRLVLRRVSNWLGEHSKEDQKYEMTVDWLPLSLFDSYSQFTINVCNTLVLDVNLHGNTGLTVSKFDDRFGEAGLYQRVVFGSVLEFECYLKIQIKRTLF